MDKLMPQDDKLLEVIKEGYSLSDTYLTQEIKKASTVEAVYSILGLEQLTNERYENFYVNTDEVRDSNTIKSLERILQDPLNSHPKTLFSGFTGSGKTTELIRLCYQLKEKFNIIIFSVLSRLKINDITIEALLFEIVEDALKSLMINNLADENDEDLKKIIKNIHSWCSETKIMTQEEEKETASLGGGLNIDFFKILFLKAKIEGNFTGSTKTQATRIEERKINNLIFECNKIFDFIKQKTGKETLIIVDDLEKVPFLKARDFYTGNSKFITTFRCSMVLTIPVELVFHSDFAHIEGDFGNARVMPMIKVKDKYGKEYKPGMDLLKEILGRRLDLSLFKDNCVRDALLYSGGSLRDLFRIIQEAVLNEESPVITKASMTKGILQLKKIFGSRIQERNDELQISFDQYLDILIDIFDGNKEQPTKNTAFLDLMRTRAVMNYNGEGFYDTHPLLDRFISLYKEKRDKAKSS
ncbi:MAG: hypothetical protein GY754_42665 [bacterium]|nr:hypothetical protein [bacterium]